MRAEPPLNNRHAGREADGSIRVSDAPRLASPMASFRHRVFIGELEVLIGSSARAMDER